MAPSRKPAESQYPSSPWGLLFKLLENKSYLAVLLVSSGLSFFGAYQVGLVQFNIPRGLPGILDGPQAEVRNFVGGWRFTGANIPSSSAVALKAFTDSAYTYEGRMTFAIEGSTITVDGQYQFKTGDPARPNENRKIKGVGQSKNGYLTVMYQVNDIMTPAEATNGVMLILVRPNGRNMEGHFMVRSMRDDGQTFGRIELVRDE